MQLSFTVLGSPVGQGSKRHVGNGVMIESPKLKPWRQAVAFEAHNAMLRGDWGIEVHGLGPVSLTVTVFCPRPTAQYGKGGTVRKNAPKFPHKRKGFDLDKVARSVGDALSGVAYGDDKQIVSLAVRAFYGAPERAEITVEALK